MGKVVIFDLFHTLVSPEDVWPPGFNRERAAARALGIDETVTEVFWDGPGRSRYTGQPVAELLTDAAGRQNCSVSRSAVSAALRAYGEYHDRALAHPRKEILGALQVLTNSGYRLGLLSNADDREVAGWSDSPLSEHFERTCFSYQIGTAKPDPDAYRTLLHMLGTDAPSAVFVGDGGSHEFEGAREASIGTVVCTTGFGTVDGLRTHEAIATASSTADAVVSSVAELPELLPRLRLGPAE